MFLAERPRSPAPDRWRGECRELSDQALGAPAGRCSADRMISILCFCWSEEQFKDNLKSDLENDK